MASKKPGPVPLPLGEARRLRAGLRKLRKGYATHGELAKRLRISPAWLSRILSGDCPPGRALAPRVDKMLEKKSRKTGTRV